MTDQAIIRRYNFKLYPSKAQAEALDRIRRMHAAFYNAALQERIDAYRLARKTLTQYDQGRHIKTVRADDPAYEAISADSLNGTLARLDRAFKAFFRRAKAGAGASSGFPRYKRADDYPGFWHRWKQGWAMDLRPGAGAGCMTVKGVTGAIKLRGRFPLPPIKILTCDVKLDGGVWWASVAVQIAARMRRDRQDTGEVTFDLIDSFARVRRVNGGHAAGPDDAVNPVEDGRISPLSHRVVSDRMEAPSICGDTVGGIRSRDRVGKMEAPSVQGATRGCGAGDGIHAIARRMSRCKRGSNRYRALRRNKARSEARAARQRRERLHLWTTQVARLFADLTIITPPIRETTRSGRGTAHDPGAAVDFKAELNRRILAMAPASAAAMLEYKLAERGGSARVIEDERHPTAAGNLIVEAVKSTRKLKRKVNAQ